MDTKKLEALAAAVQYGRFTRAAEALGYTQSGMTHMMNSLERDIGFPVLLRGRGGVRLTPAGERIYPLVREDKTDVGFASLQDGMTMDWVPLAEDPLLAILPPEYDLRGRDRFNVEDFAGQEFLMPSLGFHLDILRALNRSNVTPVIRTTQVSDSVIISMVEHGLGVSVLSELVLKGRRDAVQAGPLDPPAFRELGIVTRDRRELRPAARRFITEARDIIRQIK